MSIVPVIAFVAAILLALIFEWVYAYLDARMTIALEQGEWTFLYWLAVYVLGITTGVMANEPPQFPKNWVAFSLVALVHVCINLLNPGVLPFRWNNPNSASRTQTRQSQQSQPPSQTKPSKSAAEDDRNIH